MQKKIKQNKINVKDKGSNKKSKKKKVEKRKTRRVMLKRKEARSGRIKN